MDHRYTIYSLTIDIHIMFTLQAFVEGCTNTGSDIGAILTQMAGLGIGDNGADLLKVSYCGKIFIFFLHFLNYEAGLSVT